MGQAETEQLNKIILGAALSQALSVVCELGIADQIQSGGPKSVTDLAVVTGAHEQSLYRVLRLLASHGLFEEKTDRVFDHTRLSSCLRSDYDGSYRAGARMFHALFRGWDGLHHAVMTGEPGFQKVFGQPMFDYIGDNPDLAPLFDAGMTAFHGPETAAMLDAYDFSSIDVLADIGGGNGSLLAEVLQQHPKLKGILFDLGHVVARASAFLQDQSLDDRCTVVEGNFFESIPGGADAYLFRHIIHDWTDEQSIQILKNCRRVIPDHGRVLIVEYVVPPGNEPSFAKDMDITMLVFPGGAERTSEEYRLLFERAGFQFKGVTRAVSEICIVEGTPA